MTAAVLYLEQLSLLKIVRGSIVYHQAPKKPAVTGFQRKILINLKDGNI